MASQTTEDFFIAYDVHEKLNCLGVTDNAISSEKENYKPRTLIDQTLELIDPTPNIHTLFVQFNARFFWNVLLPVEVKWSNRMTSCAGICTFRSRTKQCVISLSAPLLKLRPRKDLVETLLHEMIHGYLFLTNNDRDRDGHGPEFCKHMNRINKEADTNITIYHNFHNEVKLYQQHWWKCNGPCQYRPPFFGTVRRAMNRAPGPSDFWWIEHRQNCNGQFIKIREPENFKSHSRQNDKSKSISKDKKPEKNITDWFAKNIPYLNDTASTSVSTYENKKNNQDLSLELKKLGNSSNNVYGWGPNRIVEKDMRNVSRNTKFAYSGVVGGSNGGQSNLLNKFLHINSNKSCSSKSIKKDSSLLIKSEEEKRVNKSVVGLNRPKIDAVCCPICNAFISLVDINEHIDLCLVGDDKTKERIEISADTKYKTRSVSSINELDNDNENPISSTQTFSASLAKVVDTIPNKRLKLNDLNCLKYASCPVCNKMLPYTDINQHLDECLLETDTVPKISTSPNSCILNNDSVISINSSSSSDDLILDDTDNPKVQSDIDIKNISVIKDDAMNEIHKQKCLVCNAQISYETSLNEHLEECIGAVFNDDIMDNEDDDNIPVVENNFAESKYPCPVCMQVMSENLMNQHLDICLKNK